MRGFKKSIYFGLSIYIALVIHKSFLIFNYDEVINNSKNYIKNTIINSSIGKPRIIIFGSSHCDYGVSAESIEIATGYKTFNLCLAGSDTQENFQEILKLLKPNDLILYSIRIEPSKEERLAGLKNMMGRMFFPEFGFTLVEFFKIKIVYNDKGDRISYPKKNSLLKMQPTLDIKSIQSKLFSTLSYISKQESLEINRPQIILITAPIFTSKANKFDHNFEINYQIFPNVVYWLPPILSSDKNLFTDETHVNILGREMWTTDVIKAIKIKLNL